MRITIRLTDEEAKHLAEICKSDIRGDLTASETIRLLITREFNRRKGLPKPQAAEYQTVFRTGRPRKTV